MKKTTRSSAPVRSKSCMKNDASLCVMPMATKTTANCSPSPSTFACRAIWAASLLAGSPAPEKIGSFWPRTSVSSPSMADMPVWMKSAGLSRAEGLIGVPPISSTASGMMSGRPSRAFPTPVKTRPSISSETLIRAGSPMNRAVVSSVSIPRVPSNTWMIACSSEMSSTCPVRTSPSRSVIFTISPNEAPFTLLTKTSGPET